MATQPTLNPEAAEFFPSQSQPRGYFGYYYYPDTTLLPFSYEQGYQQQQQQKEHRGHNHKRVLKVWRKKGEQEAETAETFPMPDDNNHLYYPVIPVRRDGTETTVMIRNIPGKYTRDMLLEFLESHCKKVNKRAENDGVGKENEAVLAFDIVYLPIDFGSGMNKGYAFVNFTKPEAAYRFVMTASDKKWEKFQSGKVREVVAARVQGRAHLEEHLGTMIFGWQSEEILPVAFSPPRDGVIKGEMRTLGKLADQP